MREPRAWPELPLPGWQDTYETLHRWTQIVGKTRLHFAPMQNHWWQTTLYLTARGLTTSSIPEGERTFEVEFDFIDQALHLRVSDGTMREISLAPRSVAEFYQEYLAALRSLSIDVRIWPVPQEMSDTLRFDEDHTHKSYDPEAAANAWRVLAGADRLFKVFRGDFLGKCSPSHFWWGGFDLSCTRFSGRRAPPHPGGIPNLSDRVTREAYSHECISVGWWPGSPGMFDEPAFYAYAYPEPPGCPSAHTEPAGSYYHPVMHEWILPYEIVRRAPDPDGAVLEFCQSTYSAAADLGHWNRDELERSRNPDLASDTH